MSDRAPGAGLAPVRTGRYAEAAFVLAVLAGLAATWVHWAGLVVGGLLMGLVATSLPRAVTNGVTFGLTVLAAFAVWLAWQGALLTFGGLGPVPWLAAGTALGLPTAAAVALRALI